MSNNDNKQWFQKADNKNSGKNSNKPVKKNGKAPQKKSGPKPVSKNAGRPAGKPSNAPNSAKRPSSNQVNYTSTKNTATPNFPTTKAVPAPKTANVAPGKGMPAKNASKKKIFGSKKKSAKKTVNNTKPTAIPVTAEPKPKPNVAEVKPKTGAKPRQRRAKLKGIRLAIISVLIVLMSVGVMVFTVHHLLKFFAVKPEMSFIEKGSIEHTIGAKALIVRSETVINTNATGDLVTQTTEGSRVYSGQRVALVVPEDMQSVVANLRNTQSQISEVQQELIAEGSAPGADEIYSNINEGLVPIVDMIRLDSMDGNVSDMASYMSSISVLINQRESELSELKFDDERLRELRADETSYENQLQKSSAPITTNKPGIISFKLDGLEQELSFNLLLEADPSEIKEYINSSTGLITSDLYIEANESVARIANNEEQYIAVYLKKKDASVSAFQVGTLHTLNVRSEGISIGKCKVERCVSADDGMLIVFSTTHYVEDLLDLRTADIEIVITETSGLRVPTGALVNPDYSRGVATIYLNNQGFADEVGVIIEDYDREFAIISPIGDSSVPNTQSVIITNPDSIKPGEKVDK